MPPGRPPRQVDIARIAGVSQATVSVVLGGNRAGVRMAESTRRRVLAVAEDLGYVPHPVATRLASARTNMIGLYTFRTTFPTDVADSYYPILVGVEDAAAALGQDLVLFTGAAGRSPEAIRRVRVADGCLFFGRHVPDEPIARLVDSGFPIVYIGRRPELGGRIPYVGADYVTASADLVARLRALGHRRIRYVRETDDAPSSADRERGVRQAGATVTRLSGGLTTGEVRSWVADGVTAVVVEETDTGAAYTAVRGALAAAGLTVPDDVSLAVLGRPPGSAPEVTGFEVPYREMGGAAVRLLVDLITEQPTTPQRLLPCPPVPGETIGPPGEH
ncbi:LacI family DNA-binding transcriptional regulator [Actinophytocola sp. KF-1]